MRIANRIYPDVDVTGSFVPRVSRDALKSQLNLDKSLSIPPYLTRTRLLTASLFFLLLCLTACQPKTLVADDFTEADLDRWFLEGDSAGVASIADGRLVIQINQANIMQFATLRQPLMEDFVLQVDATLINGSVNSTYGVLFRMQEGGAFYRFELTGNGRWLIEKRTRDQSWIRLTDSGRWEESAAIRQGVGATNRIKIAAQGPNIVFSVNETVLKRFEGNFDSSYGMGTIALDAGTFTQGGLQVAFDNLLIQEP